METWILDPKNHVFTCFLPLKKTWKNMEKHGKTWIVSLFARHFLRNKVVPPPRFFHPQKFSDFQKMACENGTFLKTPKIGHFLTIFSPDF
jgi:hypothetical protein